MTTKIRMKIHIRGITSVGAGRTYDSLVRGQIIEVDERTAAQFLEAGYAERKLDGEIGPSNKVS
jgi:hypothetical protein